MKDSQSTSSSPKRRIYQPPQVKKQQSLKEITLFTNFGPPS